MILRNAYLAVIGGLHTHLMVAILLSEGELLKCTVSMIEMMCCRYMHQTKQRLTHRYSKKCCNDSGLRHLLTLQHVMPDIQPYSCGCTEIALIAT